MQRALVQQVSPCKPCADAHMTLPEKGSAQTGWNDRTVYRRRISVCGDMFMCCSSSVSERSQQLESGWREQGAGVLHASFYWRGYHAPCPTQVLPTRYALLSLHAHGLDGAHGFTFQTYAAFSLRLSWSELVRLIVSDYPDKTWACEMWTGLLRQFKTFP